MGNRQFNSAEHQQKLRRVWKQLWKDMEEVVDLDPDLAKELGFDWFKTKLDENFPAMNYITSGIEWVDVFTLEVWVKIKNLDDSLGETYMVEVLPQSVELKAKAPSTSEMVPLDQEARISFKLKPQRYKIGEALALRIRGNVDQLVVIELQIPPNSFHP
jgi:hypothetical protein